MLTQCPRMSELLVFERQLEDMPTASSTTHFSKASGLKHWNEAHEAIARRTWIDRVPSGWAGPCRGRHKFERRIGAFHRVRANRGLRLRHRLPSDGHCCYQRTAFQRHAL